MCTAAVPVPPLVSSHRSVPSSDTATWTKSVPGTASGPPTGCQVRPPSALRAV